MSRGVGVAEFLAGLVPAWALPVVLLATTLAEAPIVLAVVLGRYWFRERRAGMRLAIIAATAFAAMLALKHAFALPRPPASIRAPVSAVPAPFDQIYQSLLDTDESGFPSGHTTIAAAVYGGAALDAENRRRWLGVAAVLVALVGGSRLFLGVHHLADVAGGIALAAAVIGATRFADGWLDAPKGAVAVGAVGVLLSVAVVPGSTAAVAAAGVVVGVGLMWLSVDVPEEPWAMSVTTMERGLVPVGITALAATPMFVFGNTPVLAFVVAVVGTGAAVAVPAFDDLER
ncbi:phosphatase PAP2 family protein [Halorubellus sp. PRR65]|uniref:phosphatase PAP2 family protein n=1 Tax=Halorubellus sp. PRR65 TaxID=3098148 RepID=UPI002B26274C|nr:phosphatase PAP2 family protein [Halorubellus sp. PRR65]